MTLTLDQLKIGQEAVITKLVCTGITRRRMMDLGILPGTHLQAEFISPLGDPIAYRVREALIALRHEQASQIEMILVEESEV
ncbi:MAG: FeoA family protein [Anaerolineae bacterium]|nr:FeoA family protein [Anaerolineae bacterium]MDQ7034093.1 FeoA family protein [Anaerolineae bacterium]